MSFDVQGKTALLGKTIVAALQSGEFNAFPDSMARQLGAAYQGFSKNVVEAETSEASSP
jgi:hypothetical protein